MYTPIVSSSRYSSLRRFLTPSTGRIGGGWVPPDDPDPGPVPKPIVDPPSETFTPKPIKLELFAPSSPNNAAVAGTENPPTNYGTRLTYDANNDVGKQWLAKLTNLDTSPAWLELGVTYPGRTEIRQFVLPLSAAEDFLRNALAGCSIRVTRGECDLNFGPISSIIYILDAKFGGNTVYPNDINSRAITIRLNNATQQFLSGFLTVDVLFEEDGKEIAGDYTGNILGMSLSLLFSLAPEYWQLRYNHAYVSFTIKDIDIDNFPDDLIDFFTNYKQNFVQNVKDIIYDSLNSELTKNTVGSAVTSLVLGQLGAPNGKIRDVTIENDLFKLTYTMPPAEGNLQKRRVLRKRRRRRRG